MGFIIDGVLAFVWVEWAMEYTEEAHAAKYFYCQFTIVPYTPRICRATIDSGAVRDTYFELTFLWQAN